MNLPLDVPTNDFFYKKNKLLLKENIETKLRTEKSNATNLIAEDMGKERR